MFLQKQKKIAVALLVITFLVLPCVSIFAKTGIGGAKDDLDKFGKGAGFDTTGTGGDIDVVVGSILKYFLSFFGVIFLTLLIYGGWLWMNARGSEEDVEKSKDTMINAAIGLMIVLGAYFIADWIVYNLALRTLEYN